MNDRTPPRLRLVALVALVALASVFAGAGWLAGRSTREAPRCAESPAHRGALAASAVAGALHPRPAYEWQGMLVDLSQRQRCEASSSCGLALACLPDRKCGPCERDDQCAAGEACVLDHCVAAANVGCRTRAECGGAGDDAMCVLSGLSGGDPRGNANMRSFCRSTHKSRGAV